MAIYGKEFTICYVAWDSALGSGKTGDVANHTLRWVKDGTASAPTNSPSEVDATNTPGIYKLTLTATETSTPFGVLAGKSSTASVVISPVAISFERVPDADPGAIGGLPVLDANGRVLSYLDTGGITSSTLDATALQSIRNEFLALNDSLSGPTVTPTTVTLSGSGALNDDAYNGFMLFHCDNSLSLIQMRTIVDYDHATLTITVDRPWTVNPVDTDRILVYQNARGLARVNPVKGVALGSFEFTMYDSTNHAPVSGLTVTAERSIDGGAYGACSNGVSGVSDGTYKIDLSASDMNGNIIKLKFTATGADQQDMTIVTQE